MKRLQTLDSHARANHYLSSHLDESLQNGKQFPPNEEIQTSSGILDSPVEVQVMNCTSLQAARLFEEMGQHPLVLNFANGTGAGGGFLTGSRAQEETLCFASTLSHSLFANSEFYDYHKSHGLSNESSSYALVSKVKVFCDDEYNLLSAPWNMDVITCAAPKAKKVGRERSNKMMSDRVARVLAIAQSLGYEYLVLGAWGCGAFGNDTEATAKFFRENIETRSHSF
eukprot:Awhi_evm1s9198